MRLAHLEAHGLMDLESKTPMTEDAIFKIMSLGEHTTDVLQAWLGLDGEIIDALRRQEVIA